MATLADELENDFAASGSEDEESQDDGMDGQAGALRDLNGTGQELDMEDAGDNEDAEDTEMLDESGRPVEAEEEKEARLHGPVHRMQSQGKDMQSVQSFMKSMEPILESIAHYQSLPSERQTLNAVNLEEDPQYKLLTDSNTFSTSIDDQGAEVHKHIRDHYSARFPELETLLPDSMEYTKTVAIVGNGPFDSLRTVSSSTDNLVHQSLDTILTRPKLMTVTVEATTTKGQPLPDSELQAVRNACSMMLRLEEAKKVLAEYVQSRMSLFAPNLTVLVGSRTAAQILNARGGLKNLAMTRASNIPAIGSKRAAHSGFATNVGIRNQGYLFDSVIIQQFRPELRIQAMRIVSAKIALAARVDLSRESPDGATGEQLREQCEVRLNKLIEPPPNKGHKPLPAPDDKPSKKRGGRRARKAKEATAMTDLRKAQNRMAFGKEEAEVGYGQGEGTAGMGMIGQSNEGRIRGHQVDQRTRAKLSKKNPGWGGSGTASSIGGASSSIRGFGQGVGAGNASVLKGHGLKTSGLATSLGAGSGTASSLAFTPKQGLELVDPKVRAEMERRSNAENDKYFKGGTFTQVGGEATSGKKDEQGFAVPSLPTKRKFEG